jgi:hypothetical protein
VTPSGLENGPNVTETHLVMATPTEKPGGGRPEEAAGCNECNEALGVAREVVLVARRLAMVADNAVVNGDLKRACAALRDLLETLTASASDSDRGDQVSVARWH